MCASVCIRVSGTMRENNRSRGVVLQRAQGRSFRRSDIIADP